jgi:outer membrane protein OmpA-like peptidoglycan-associated protein
MKQYHWQVPSSLLYAGCLLLGMSGCVATRGWVREQIAPVSEQVAEVEARAGQADTRATQTTRQMGEVEARLGQTTSKADLALKNLEHLRLEQNFVLGIKEGIYFSTNASQLTPEARHAIDGFLQTLGGIDDVFFLVAGYTDSKGSQDHNYTLSQKRAASVARYLITEKGLDPLRVTVAAYGEKTPLADNTTPQGRLKNRRVEIQVYKEVVTSAPGPQRLDIGRTSQR